MQAGTPDRMPADLRADIARGRAVLANRAARSSGGNRRGQEAVDRLLELLWNPDGAVRHAAAHALPGGDGQHAHIPHFGHFVGAFLRGLADGENSRSMPATAAERYDCVAEVLRGLLAQNIREIRGIGNMNYSFLSSALYLAVFATCRDVLLTIRRLQVSPAQAELCSLLWSLPRNGASCRLNGADVETLAQFAGEALAMLPPDCLSDYWHCLTHGSPSRRIAAVSALAHFQDPRSVPHLLDVLQTDPAQTPAVAVPIIRCLARMEDGRALFLLQTLSDNRAKSVRLAARSAVAAIERAGHKQPSRTLLRATHFDDANHSETMLRPVPVNHHNTEPPEEMLRPAGS